MAIANNTLLCIYVAQLNQHESYSLFTADHADTLVLMIPMCMYTIGIFITTYTQVAKLLVCMDAKG